MRTPSKQGTDVSAEATPKTAKDELRQGDLASAERPPVSVDKPEQSPKRSSRKPRSSSASTGRNRRKIGSVDQKSGDSPASAPVESASVALDGPSSAATREPKAPAPKDKSADTPAQGGPAEADAPAKRRSRRGKRGGKSRNHKVFRTPLEIVAAITTFLALPPATGLERQRRPAKTPAGKKTASKSASKSMIISVMPQEQVEVAVAENGKLLEYYLDLLHQRKIKGNIYKGVIHNIDVNLQAAFVDYGAGKNGFLQIDQVHPEYWQSTQESEKGKKFPPIQKVLKIGQELLVQVVKEPAGSKGAFLTTWLSLAGRFLVLTPGQEQIGVSRKVTEPEERSRLREMMSGIDPGKGFGVIVRTVGEGANKTTLKNDLQYLKRLWREIRKKATEMSAPARIHQEPGLPERSVRDYLTEDVGEIWVDDASEAEHVRAMVALLYPRKKDLVHLYEDNRETIWDKFHLRSQLSQIYDREVSLPSGGRLVFDQTEALMAIDINSGRISGKGNFENMAFKTNMEAAEAIARQLRLRDIGGQVVIDFIEMRDKNHVLEVEKCLRQAMKSDRAKHDVARMSSFGLLELVRQRMGSSALSICLETCPICGGTGMRRNLEWHAQQSLGELRQKMRHFSGGKFVFELPRELGMYLLNQKRDALRRLEEETGKTLEINITI